jgi:hypothetical protein
MTVAVDDRVADGTVDGVAAGVPDGAAVGVADRAAAGADDRMAAGADGVTDTVDSRPLDESPDAQPPVKSAAATTAHTPAATSGDFRATSRNDLIRISWRWW